MTVNGIALFFALIATFMGLALLMLERKERKAWTAKAQEEAAKQAAEGEDGQVHLVKEGEQVPLPPYHANIQRLKLGWLFLCQGSLAVIFSIALFFINRYAIKIAWYICLVIDLVYFGVCFLTDALLMAPKAQPAEEQAAPKEQSDEDKIDKSILPEKAIEENEEDDAQ